MSQTAALSEVDIHWLARHLGHDVHVHREFSRLPEVSNLLLDVDLGNLGKISVEGTQTQSLFPFNIIKQFALCTNLAKLAERVKRHLCKAKVNIVFYTC